MSATLRKLDGEPILIVTYEGFLDLKVAEAMAAQVAQVLAESDVPLYGIIDLRTATTTMGELIRILVSQARDARGTLAAEKNRVVFVGSHPLLRIFRSLFAREPTVGMFLPIFTTMEEALTFTRARVGSARVT